MQGRSRISILSGGLAWMHMHDAYFFVGHAFDISHLVSVVYGFMHGFGLCMHVHEDWVGGG